MASSEISELLQHVGDNPELAERIKNLIRDRDATDLLQHFWLDAEIRGNYTTHLEYEIIRGTPSQIKKRWYRKAEPLGRGAYGNVWLEQESKTLRYRAVKVIRKQSINRDKIDYKKEILALAKFSKPQYQQQEVLVGLLGWYENVSDLFLYMDYFELGDLEQHIGDGIKEDDARDITTNLLNGLRIMHDENFTHRDLKPRNVFVVRKSPKWWVKIGDFGISKRVNNDETALYTSVGTRHYIAPEITGDLDSEMLTSIYSSAVDIWSLGCVIYKVATNAVPFPETRDIRRFCDGRDPFPETPLGDKLSASGVAFLKRLLVAEPERRVSATQALEDPWFTEYNSPEIGKKNEGSANTTVGNISAPPSLIDDDRKQGEGSANMTCEDIPTQFTFRNGRGRSERPADMTVGRNAAPRGFADDRIRSPERGPSEQPKPQLQQEPWGRRILTRLWNPRLNPQRKGDDMVNDVATEETHHSGTGRSLWGNFHQEPSLTVHATLRRDEPNLDLDPSPFGMISAEAVEGGVVAAHSAPQRVFTAYPSAVHPSAVLWSPPPSPPVRYNTRVYTSNSTTPGPADTIPHRTRAAVGNKNRVGTSQSTARRSSRRASSSSWDEIDSTSSEEDDVHHLAYGEYRSPG